jgi:serine/threonine protein kinase
MGMVYLAEQHEPVRRQVALKVLRAGTGTAEIVARFRSEQQMLATMEHPNITRVYDAGVTDAGRT